MEKNLIVKDSSEQGTTKKPQRLNITARLMSETIRSFAIICLLCIVSLVSICFAWSEAKRADSNIKVAWVKMYPNGTWDVEFHDENRQQEFFQATIDYIITQWVERRYQEFSHSIKTDYGYVYIFMSPDLRSDFLSPDGYNAPAKAAEIADCTACRQVKIKVRNIDHYDSDKTRFGQYQGILYRTNVFVNKTILNADGSPSGDEPEKLIVPIQWRIMAKEEIQAQKDILKQNPIGLEIVSYDLLKDVS